MSKRKIVIIWSSVSITLLICVLAVLNLSTTAMNGITAPQYQKYGLKIGSVIYNEDKPSDNLPGVLKLRAIICDSDLDVTSETVYFDTEWMLGDYSITYTYLFVCEGRETPDIASGCWSNVYRYDPGMLNEDDRESNLEMRTSFAMFDFEKAIQQGYGEEIQKMIREDDEVCIFTDEYAINDLVLIPMHITVLKDGNVIKEYTPNSVSDIPAGYEIIRDDEVWIYNKNYQSLSTYLTNIDLSNIKEIERLRSIAQDVAANIDFDNPEYTYPEYELYAKVSTTPSASTIVNYGVIEDDDGSRYSLVIVQSIHHLRITIIMSAIVIGTWTLLFAIIVFAFRKRKTF